MSNDTLLKIRLSLKGRPIKGYTFDGETVVIGRDPDADIFLDNTGISRAHAKIDRMPQGGFMIEDLNSANGTYVNDKAVAKQLLNENDVIRVGKFSLWVTLSEDRRAAEESSSKRVSADECTTVLSGDQLSTMLNSAREIDERAVVEGFNDPQHVGSGSWFSQPNKTVLVIAMSVAFMIGSALGAGATTWLLRH
jgi:pSer/pThr/pTyr-binding forkhead associated (FHA) protein